MPIPQRYRADHWPFSQHTTEVAQLVALHKHRDGFQLMKKSAGSIGWFVGSGAMGSAVAYFVGRLARRLLLFVRYLTLSAGSAQCYGGRSVTADLEDSVEEPCRSLWRWSVMAACALSIVCLSSVARAESSEQRRATAEALFNEAGSLFKQGNYVAACDKLAKSQRLDPAVGTLLNLGRCYEKIGRTASAWLAFVDAASAAKSAGQTERGEVARQGVARLAPLVPKLLVKVPDEIATDDLEISRSGESVPKALWNIASPTDPGDHEIEVKAPGKKSWSKKIHLDPAKQETVEIPVLEDDPTQAKGKHAAEKAKSGLGTQKILALVTGGVGVVGLGVGGGLFLSARSDAKRANEGCEGSTCQDTESLSANDRALKKANLATIFLSAGAGLLVGGTVVWLTAPSQQDVKRGRVGPFRQAAVTPVLDRSMSGLLVEGRF